VCILFAFLGPVGVVGVVLVCVARFACWVGGFDYRLRDMRRFPVALYLAPDPDGPFSALTDAVHRAFPDYPPFAGKFDVVVPHVTVAHGDEPQLCEIEVELRIALPPAGIAAHCAELILIENGSGRWETLRTFALGERA
jgi:hypothetical protein